MDREISKYVEIAVAMIAISVVITLVMFTVHIGDELKLSLVTQAVDIEIGVSTGQLDSIAGGHIKVMPKASIYYIIAKEYKGVRWLEYNGVVYKANREGYWTKNGEVSFYGDNKRYILPIDILDEDPPDGKVAVLVERVGRGVYDVKIDNVFSD